MVDHWVTTGGSGEIPSPIFTSPLVLSNEQKIAVGGLRIYVYYVEDGGVSTRVFGPLDEDWVEIIRFDDFPGNPHFHAPFPGAETKYDAANGEPYQWFLEQIRAHLPDWLEKTDRTAILEAINLDEVSEGIGMVDAAMVAAAPDGYERIPGLGLQRVS